MDAAGAAHAAAGAAAYADAGFGWWRAVGGTLVVFALLVLFLRFLARWQGTGPRRLAGVVAVLPLGPRREIEVVRLRDRVHYVYRREGSLVALGEEPFADWERAAADDAQLAVPAAAGGWLARLRGAARGGRPSDR